MDNVQYFLGVYEKTTEKDGQPIGVQGEGRRVDGESLDVLSFVPTSE